MTNRKPSIPRQNIIRSSPCDPDLKLRFYNFYVRTGTIEKTALKLGISRSLVSKVLQSEEVSEKTKLRLAESLDLNEEKTNA